jgi:hypothetical protein
MANLNIRQQEWAHPGRSQHPLGDVSFFGYEQAQERGRSMAAQAMRVNPEAKARVEAVYGEAYCRKRYPEAYSRVQKVWDFLKGN